MSIKETAISRLLNSQSAAPNWNAFIETIADYFADYVTAIVALQTSTWKDTAEGVWLDRGGEIVGVGRPPAEEIERVFRCREDTDPEYDALHGFGNYISAANSSDGLEHGNASLGGLLWGATGIIISGDPADDAVYLDFIDAKIAATNSDASVPGLAKFIAAAFDIDCTITTGDKIVYIQLDDVINIQQRRFLEFFVPVVAGVQCVITNWPDWGV